MKNRTVLNRLVSKGARKHGRLLVLTGARQTGKTTLVRQAFPDYAYISLEDPVLRPHLARLSAADWVERYPRAILDEVQKAPSVVESIKAAHDSSASVRYVLLGSSQILLLKQIKESLAGRALLEELWPLTLPEAGTRSWEDPVPESRLIAWLRGGARGLALLQGMPAADRSFSRAVTNLDAHLRFGGMPAVHDPDLPEEERLEWLQNYQRLYLERDVADLAALRDLEPFVLAHRAAAARSGKTVHFSELARLAGINITTARRYLRYLELSYQVMLLPAFSRNLEKRLVKMPKLLFTDPGVLRSILNRRGDPTGEEFESAIVTEIFKQVRYSGLPITCHHLRTHDGREVDLLLELEGGFVAVEVKLADRIHEMDARPLAGLPALLDKPLLHSLLVSRDREIRRMRDGVLAVPVAWLLSGASSQG